jgi:hypothetical protein
VARRRPIKVAWVTEHDDGTRTTEILDQDEYLRRQRAQKIPQAPPPPPATTFHARLREALLAAWFHTDFPADLVHTIGRVFSRSAARNRDTHSEAAKRYTRYRQQVSELGGTPQAIAQVAAANGVSEKTVRRALKK